MGGTFHPLCNVDRKMKNNMFVVSAYFHAAGRCVSTAGSDAAVRV